MHPAHTLDEGDVTLGAGMSGRLPLAPDRLAPESDNRRILEESAFAPGVAPWVAGRFGFGGGYEAGLTYSGRTIRVDGRRAFDLGVPTLSVGVAASGLLPKRRDELGIRVGGFGGDIPLMLGVRSDDDVYAAWLGLRGGAELLSGQRDLPADPLTGLAPSEEIGGWHAHAGGLLGMRIGGRYLAAVLELNGAMHFAAGTVGANELEAQLFELSPAGALIANF